MIKRLIISAISLIELIIAIVLLSILLLIGVNAWSNLQKEIRRQEAHSELIKLKINIEQNALSGQWKAPNGTVNNVSSVIELATLIKNYPVSLQSPNGYYTITVLSVSPNSYTLQARANSAQSGDLACVNIWLEITTTGDQRTPIQCW